MYEFCSNCESEVRIKSKFIRQTCPKCGKSILPCSLCDLDIVICELCDLNEERVGGVHNGQDTGITDTF